MFIVIPYDSPVDKEEASNESKQTKVNKTVSIKTKLFPFGLE